MNKNTIIASILFLLIGFGVGYIYVKNGSSVDSIVENQEVKTGTVVPVQNKLFTFLDSFKNIFIDPVAKDRGSIGMSNVEPELGLMIIEYSTTQESDGYSIYDYHNDILYKNIGQKGLDGSFYPLSFVNKNKVLMSTYSEEGEGTYALSVKDFVNNTTTQLPLILTGADSVSAKLDNNKVSIYVRTMNKKSSFPESTFYDLDSKTLEIKKVK